VRSKHCQKAPWKVWLRTDMIITPTREEPMVQTHSRTPQNSTQWVSTLLAHGGSYGVVTTLSRARRCRPPEALALEAAFPPAAQGAGRGCALERAILTLLGAGHASSRGIQECLWALLGQQVSVGTIASVIQTAGKLAQQWMSQHAGTGLGGTLRQNAWTGLPERWSMCRVGPSGPAPVPSRWMQKAGRWCCGSLSCAVTAQRHSFSGHNNTPDVTSVSR